MYHVGTKGSFALIVGREEGARREGWGRAWIGGTGAIFPPSGWVGETEGEGEGGGGRAIDKSQRKVFSPSHIPLALPLPPYIIAAVS